MNTTLSWIKAYVPDLTCTAQEYTDAMTLSGTKVEGYEAADRDLDKIVIGRIPAAARRRCIHFGDGAILIFFTTLAQ